MQQLIQYHLQQYLDANPKEREKLVKGDKITSYGYIKSCTNKFLATDIAIDR